jgi:hypothetical protein
MSALLSPPMSAVCHGVNTAYFLLFQNFHRLCVRTFVPFFVRPCPVVSADVVRSVRAGFAIGSRRDSCSWVRLISSRMSSNARSKRSFRRCSNSSRCLVKSRYSRKTSVAVPDMSVRVLRHVRSRPAQFAKNPLQFGNTDGDMSVFRKRCFDPTLPLVSAWG